MADEDRKTLWRLPVPFTTDTTPERHDLPGRPANVVALGDRVLVTIREPGSLLALDRETLAETAGIALPSDAWGIAVSADRSTALVTSAWTHQVTAVDLATMKARWTVDVARDPRAVVIPTEGDRAYVSHAVGSALTRLDAVSSGEPKVSRVALPPARSRAPRGEVLDASFAMSAILSPKEDRLFVARHALGAMGRVRRGSWVGAATVDGLLLDGDEPLAPERAPRKVRTVDEFAHPKSFGIGVDVYFPRRALDGPEGPTPFVEEVPFVQPAAMVYRDKTKTLLVASQGTDMLVELDALSLEPALQRLKLYLLGAGYGREVRLAKDGGAPSGIALSADEDTAYVWCRSTFDVLAVPLVGVGEHSGNTAPIRVRVGDDPLLDGVARSDPKRGFREAAAIGRRHFYNALDDGVGEMMGCNGCHPDGRDDGHVWVEVDEDSGSSIFIGGLGILQMHGKDAPQNTMLWSVNVSRPRARQTPMLAGRVAGERRFGWRAESEDLVERIEAGFALHRWGRGWQETGQTEGRARALAAFVLKGLVPPERATDHRALSEPEKRGKALFEDDTVGCAGCHLPDSGFSNGVAVGTRLPAARAGFVDETGDAFLTPPLAYVGGTPPYLHDGSAPSLSALIANNRDRMGRTSHLSEDDRAALVAYLETL